MWGFEDTDGKSKTRPSVVEIDQECFRLELANVVLEMHRLEKDRMTSC